MTRNKLVLLVLAFFVVLFVLAAIATLHHSANIDLVISPSVAAAKLDGKQIVKPGRVYVGSGTHTVTASYNGFKTASTMFTPPRSGVKKIYIVLQPNGTTGLNWLINHPAEQKIREGYGGQEFSNNASQFADNNPIIKYLPFYGPGDMPFSIDYSFPSSSSGKIKILVTYYTDQGKNNAITWLQNKGYSASATDPNIEFIDKT